MKMAEFIKKITTLVQENSTKFYLILVNVILVVFAIWFSNVGVLPFKNIGDFAFFVALSLLLAIYRPGWAFVLFIGSLALENVNLAPKDFGLMLRPYQFLGAITIIALFFQIVSKRLPFSLPKFKWPDILPIIFIVGGFLSSLGAANKGMSLKQSVIALSFVALYFLVRIYIQSFEDLKRALPFFLSNAVVVMLYGIWQNISFLANGNSFEVMPGRPNATFTEPDWFGIYLVFLLSIFYAIVFYLNKNSNNSKTEIFNFKFSILNQFLNFQFLKKIAIYIGIVSTVISLILTVSRSAWIGAVFVTVVFLKSTLLGKYAELNENAKSKWQNFVAILKFRNFDWKEFFRVLEILTIVIISSIAIVYISGLTRFQLFNRAASTGGMQKITIACPPNLDCVLPYKINNLEEIKSCRCRHINLEDIEKEKVAGNRIMEVLRPDPNINIRADIYQKSWQQIKQNPIFGIGWGSISKILGTDERGAGLNASNIFLEVWLGAGLLGFVSFVILLLYIVIMASLAFLANNDKNKNSVAIVFVMLGWAAIVIPNLFNSGIFLGFVWVYLAIAIGLLTKK